MVTLSNVLPSSRFLVYLCNVNTYPVWAFTPVRSHSCKEYPVILTTCCWILFSIIHLAIDWGMPRSFKDLELEKGSKSGNFRTNLIEFRWYFTVCCTLLHLGTRRLNWILPSCIVKVKFREITPNLLIESRLLQNLSWYEISIGHKCTYNSRGSQSKLLSSFRFSLSFYCLKLEFAELMYVKRILLLDRRCELCKIILLMQVWPLWHLELQFSEAFLHGHLRVLHCLHLQADPVKIAKEALCIASVWLITISGADSLIRRLTGLRSNWLPVYSTEKFPWDVPTR